jgi:hypothetical protein
MIFDNFFMMVTKYGKINKRSLYVNIRHIATNVNDLELIFRKIVFKYFLIF